MRCSFSIFSDGSGGVGRRPSRLGALYSILPLWGSRCRSGSLDHETCKMEDKAPHWYSSGSFYTVLPRPCSLGPQPSPYWVGGGVLLCICKPSYDTTIIA
jgi:hypothetical protein